MKITEQSISRTFEGLKALSICSVISAVGYFFNYVDFDVIAISRYMILIIGVFLSTFLSGLVSMLFSPFTYKVSGYFDISSNVVICRVISVLYFIMYGFITLLIANIIAEAVMRSGEVDGLKPAIIIGCLTVAIIQATRFYKLIK